MRPEAVRQRDRTRARRSRTSLVLGHIVARVGVRHRRPQLQRGLGADEVVGPRERPKEGTTPAVKRPASVAGSHPQPRLFGAGLPSRAHPHLTCLVVQLKVGCPSVLMWVSSASAIRTPAPTPSHGRTPLVPRAPSTTAEATSPAVTCRSHPGSNPAPSSSAR